MAARRRGEWERLDALARRAGFGRGRLSPAEIEELGRLYRRATSDLAIARRDFPQDTVTRYLGHLVGRAHPAVYRRPPGDRRRFWRFLAAGFPRAFRASWRYTLAAALLFFVPAVLAFAAVWLDPLNGRVIVVSRPFVEGVESGRSWLDIAEPQRGFMASFIMANNIQVAFLAFAGGVLFGVGPVVVLVWNGLSLGAIAGLAGRNGLGPTLAGFVLAHSGIELSVVCIAGGAGLRLGRALLAPGFLPRRLALSRAAAEAIRLVGGCVPLLVCAGLLEGFVSPSGLPWPAKLAIGGAATALLYAYLLLAGRGATAASDP